MYKTGVHCVCRGNERASLLVCDADLYVIVRKLLDSVLNVTPAFTRRWEIQTESKPRLNHVNWGEVIRSKRLAGLVQQRVALKDKKKLEYK
jgi:hypothetical protein